MARARLFSVTPRVPAARSAPVGGQVGAGGVGSGSYGLAITAVVGEGRMPRSRLADLLIAATAHANGLDLHTRNGDDFLGLADLVHVIAI